MPFTAPIHAVGGSNEALITSLVAAGFTVPPAGSSAADINAATIQVMKIAKQINDAATAIAAADSNPSLQSAASDFVSAETTFAGDISATGFSASAQSDAGFMFASAMKVVATSYASQIASYFSTGGTCPVPSQAVSLFQSAYTQAEPILHAGFGPSSVPQTGIYDATTASAAAALISNAAPACTTAPVGSSGGTVTSTSSTTSDGTVYAVAVGAIALGAIAFLMYKMKQQPTTAITKRR